MGLTGILEAPVQRDGATRLALLGGFRLESSDEIDVPEASQRLLAYLALGARPQRRAAIAGHLWPEKDEGRAAANLRSSLWRLRCLDGLELVRCCGPSLALSPQVLVDIHEAEQYGWLLVREGAGGLGHCDPTLFLQELLPGWYDDWVIIERERLQQLQVRFLDALSRALTEKGRLTEALDVALRLVAQDTFRERSQETLISVYLADGDLGQAHRQFERYERLMLENFGCPPTPSLRALLTNAIASR